MNFVIKAVPLVSLGKKSFQTHIMMNSRKIPVKLNVADQHISYAKDLWEGMNRRLSNSFAQQTLLKTHNLTDIDIHDIEITPHLRDGKDTFDRETGRLNLQHYTAQNLRGEKLALVLNGGGPRGIFLHLGFIESLQKRGIKPDMIIGTSAGAIVGALYATYGDADVVKHIIFNTLTKHSTISLADLDMCGFSDFARHNGLLKGEKVFNIFKEDFGLGRKRFNDMKIPLLITATDLNSSKEYIFSAPDHEMDQLIEDPELLGRSVIQKHIPNFFNREVTVANALRCSMGMPFFFKPWRMTITGKKGVEQQEFIFTDGGVKENSAFKTAACFTKIGRVLVGDPGYPGQMKDPARKMNFVKVLMQSIDLMMNTQKDTISDSIMKDPLSVRILNYGAWNIGQLDAFFCAQILKTVGRLSSDALLEACPKDLWGKWDIHSVFPRSVGARFKRFSVNPLEGQNTEMLYDTTSPITGLDIHDRALLINDLDGREYEMKKATLFEKAAFLSKIAFQLGVSVPVLYSIRKIKERLNKMREGTEPIITVTPINEDKEPGNIK